MSRTTNIGCACGRTSLEVQGDPIVVSECLCDTAGLLQIVWQCCLARRTC